MARRNLILLLAAVILASIPLFMSFEGEEAFGGADGQAQDAIHQIRPD
jgi:ABC-type cobalt transport system substrate-binding protein